MTNDVKVINAKELTKVEDFKFGTLTCDVYTDNKGNFFMTRDQIGTALEYDDPRVAIAKIHSRHKDRLDRYSVVTSLVTVDGKEREMFLYNAEGVYEIYRHSRQPMADAFYDAVYRMLEGLRLGYLKLEAEKHTSHWQQARIDSKVNRSLETDAIKEFVNYAKTNGSKRANNYYTNFASLENKHSGITQGRNNATTDQLEKLVRIQNAITGVIRHGIASDQDYHDIYKQCKSIVPYV